MVKRFYASNINIASDAEHAGYRFKVKDIWLNVQIKVPTNLAAAKKENMCAMNRNSTIKEFGVFFHSSKFSRLYINNERNFDYTKINGFTAQYFPRLIIVRFYCLKHSYTENRACVEEKGFHGKKSRRK